MSTEHIFAKHYLPTHTDARGELTVLDGIDRMVKWPVRRSYWITRTRSNRGGHCVKGEKKFYIMAQGTCRVKLFDGRQWHEMDLKGPGEALELKADLWREMSEFSENAVMFTLCNLCYDQKNYIYDLSEYTEYAKSIDL